MGCTRPLVRFADGEITTLKKYLLAGKRHNSQLNIEGPFLEESLEKKLLRKLKDENAQLLPCVDTVPAVKCKMQAAGQTEWKWSFHTTKMRGF